MTTTYVDPRAPFASLSVDFIGSFPDPAVRLDPVLPEIAIIGRSNVGKSSLLNALTGRANLARVSQTPGKTQHVNVFRLPGFYLVDLPGYGFAKASKVMRAEFRKLVIGYLTQRETLGGICWLLDCRHSPSKEDYEFQELLAESGRPVLVVLTKGDKFGRMARLARVPVLARELGVDERSIQLVSAKEREGVTDLGISIASAMGVTLVLPPAPVAPVAP